MNYPKFFDKVESIKLNDPLAEVLGAFEKGDYEISYTEVVKAAGHSCPTVAGAYLMTKAALELLYPDTRAIRGDIKVEFKESLEDGVAGVIGNVITQITGATQKSGFKGLQGKYARHSLMFFDAPISTSARFTRLSNMQSVEVIYDPNIVPPNPQMMPLLQKILKGEVSTEQKQLFAQMWQKRVEEIFENKEKVLKII